MKTKASKFESKRKDLFESCRSWQKNSEVKMMEGREEGPCLLLSLDGRLKLKSNSQKEE